MNKANINDARSKYGVVRKREDGRSIVVFERVLNHSVEKVWAAIADPEQRQVWSPGIKFESRKDARFDIWFGGDCEGPAHVTGTLSEYDPPHVLQMGSIRFELEEADGGCLLRFTDVLWFDGKRTKTEFSNSVLGGWHRFLDKMEYYIDEGQPEPTEPDEPDYSKIDVPGRE